MKTWSPLYTEILSHLLTVGGFLLAVFLIARLMSEKRQPGNTMAWLLVIVLIPYVGVPLYLLLGGRKLRRLVARKSRLSPHALGRGRRDLGRRGRGHRPGPRARKRVPASGRKHRAFSHQRRGGVCRV